MLSKFRDDPRPITDEAFIYAVPKMHRCTASHLIKPLDPTLADWANDAGIRRISETEGCLMDICPPYMFVRVFLGGHDVLVCFGDFPLIECDGRRLGLKWDVNSIVVSLPR